MGWRCVLLLVGMACAQPHRSVVIDRIVPGSGDTTTITPVRIEGSGFHLAIQSDVDDGMTVVGDVSVWVGEIPITGITWRGEQLIEGTVPEGVTPGTYDVTVSLRGRIGVLPEGFVVAPRPFDPALDCPPDYTTTLPGSTSRYRIVHTTELAWPQYAACNADLPDRTHAVVLGSMEEITALGAVLDAMDAFDRYYVGGVQSPAAARPDADWIAFDGSPLIGTAWHAPENEPDDLGGTDGIENQEQQLVIFDRLLPYLHDATGITAYGIVCECDGVPIHPIAAMWFDLDPNNPN